MFFYCTNLSHEVNDSAKRFVKTIIERKTPADLKAALNAMDDDLGLPPIQDNDGRNAVYNYR